MKKTLLPESFLYLLSFGLIYIAIELITGVNYPVFRDEFYYLDCSNHLSWGYVDHPSLSIFILFLWKTIFGSSLLSIRVLPAFAGGFLILLTGFITRSLGGSKGAQIFSAIAVFAVPTYLVTSGFYSMNAFDMVFWSMLFYILIKIINTQNPKQWLWFGIAAGFGLMNKISIAYFGAGVAAAMIFTNERKWFKNKFFWLGGALALIIFSPYIIWNVQNDYATLEFIRNATKFKNADIPVLGFFTEQIMQTNPFNFFIWVIGIIALFTSENLKKYRVIAIAYIFIFIILAVQKSKPYYLAAVYPVLISAGAVAVTEFLTRKHLGFVLPVYASLTLILIAVFSPILIPILPPNELITYMDKLHYKPNTGERMKVAGFPQYLADRFGWEEMTEKATGVYNSLTPEEKRHTAIYCGNYGEAGAINYYGKKYNLPETISGHNSHWFWPPQNDSIDILIVIGNSMADVKKSFDDVQQKDTVYNEFAMPYESNVPIFIARKPKHQLNELWPSVKMYI